MGVGSGDCERGGAGGEGQKGEVECELHGVRLCAWMRSDCVRWDDGFESIVFEDVGDVDAVVDVNVNELILLLHRSAHTYRKDELLPVTYQICR